MSTRENIVRVAREGAGRYFPSQMELLEKFSAIDCGSKNEAGNKKVVEMLESVFESMDIGLEHQYAPGIGTHLIGRIMPENNTGKIVLLAHTDTVFGEGETQKHPFRIEGDWAYGLGIADCKGGLLTSIFAVKIMQEANLLPDKEIVFLLNCDEEMGSPSSKDIFKGIMEGAEFAFAFEPTREQNGVYTSRGGVAEGTIAVAGIAAHTQLRYDEGRSAVVELSNLILKLNQKNNRDKNPVYNVAPISGGRSPGVIADEAHAGFCAAFTSAEGLERAMKDIKALENEGIVEGCAIQTDFRLLFPPMERTEGNQKAYRLVKTAGEIMGLEVPEGSTPGSGDVCFASYCGVPSIDCLGPYMCDIHSVNERVRIPSIKERTELFAIVLGIIGTGLSESLSAGLS